MGPAFMLDIAIATPDMPHLPHTHSLMSTYVSLWSGTYSL